MDRQKLLKIIKNISICIPTIKEKHRGEVWLVSQRFYFLKKTGFILRSLALSISILLSSVSLSA